MNEEEPRLKGWPTPPGLWLRLKPEARRIRHQPTAAESILWASLRNRKLGGFRFRRQHAIGRFIVDFYCSDLKLVVEVDGQIHKGRRDEDEARDNFLRERGLSVLRFSNDRVEGALDEALAEIAEIRDAFNNEAVSE